MYTSLSFVHHRIHYTTLFSFFKLFYCYLVSELADARRWETENLSFHTTKQAFVYAKTPTKKVYSLRVWQEKKVLENTKSPIKLDFLWCSLS